LTGNGYKLQGDLRVTRVGRVLRALSLDELPQLFNVLRGEMSLVGPRPGIAYELDHYLDWHFKRLQVRPGITGLWQVMGRDRLPAEEMMRLDCRYVDRCSLGLDLKILALTIPTVLGLRHPERASIGPAGLP
jgi:lipopolysaccharide/colanic/teichoic acid biosynthesis glycosyltransferase